MGFQKLSVEVAQGCGVCLCVLSFIASHQRDKTARGKHDHSHQTGKFSHSDSFPLHLWKLWRPKGGVLTKQRRVSSSVLGPCLAPACHVTGNTCCRFCSPGFLPRPTGPAGARSQHVSSFRKGEWKLWFTSAPPSPAPNLSSLLLQPLLVIMWIEAVIELRKLLQAGMEHTRKGTRPSHSSFSFARYSGTKILGAVLKWYLVIIALAGHCSSVPVTQGHCKVVWTKGAAERLGTIHSPVIMRLIPKRSELLNQTLIKAFCKWCCFYSEWEEGQSGGQGSQSAFWKYG